MAFVLSACVVLIPSPEPGLGKEKTPPATVPVKVLILDDSDDDFQTAPFEDAVVLLTATGHVAHRIGGLNVCETIGGCRAIMASLDGRSLIVCENVADRITAYEIGTGNPLWSLPGEFTAAVVHGDTVYALKADGSVYGKEIMAIDSQGDVLRQADLGGSDIAVDPHGNVLWLVGENIKKCDTSFNVLWHTDPIQWCASSVDVVPDGSAWVAERAHVQTGGTNRLLHIAPDGTIASTIPVDMSPTCVRVDPSDKSVWVSGIRIQNNRKLCVTMRNWPDIIGYRDDYQISGRPICKYSMQGQLLWRSNDGGESLDFDPSDGSVWIGGQTKVWHCSRDGVELHTYDCLSSGQKWICIVPPDR
ncbi:MAG: hypothetical protein KBE65_03550 [Phycisphaerae bacterium]|nr:hypothetical protein [Phycisphaerae bacterium]